ncbi:MAG TPA: hypothetical protein VM915_09405, partial [Verrucomicrobiae bacterium]|nr:hypothetical protein [Verrucomicrobiae bacterium]
MKLIGFCTSMIARALSLTLMLASAIVLSTPASAQTLPSARIGTAQLISPSAANTYYAGASGAPGNINRQTATPDEVTELARALRNDPDLIYDYVRNTIDITWIYGLQRGSLGAIIDRSGTSFDQARLMVDLLLAAGHSSARYRHGTITLTGSQFEAWSGLTSATAACQLLSSGAIPAIINGSTTADCNYGSASLTTITLAHVWVSVSIGGTTYYFDPSYKGHDVNAGVANLNSAAGLTPGAPLTEATSGMNSGTASGVTWVQALDSEDLGDLVQTYAETLQTYVQTNLPDGDMDDFVGGATITRADGQVRQTSYGDSGATTWTAVPDPYRAMLGVHITHEPDGAGPQVEMFDYTFFADEIYGRRLLVETNFRNGVSWANIKNFVATLRLRDGRNNAVDIDTYTLNDHLPPVREGVIELTANHPYAADSGAYMDRVVTRPIEMVIPLVILHGWGDVSPGLQAAWGSFQDLALPYVPPRGCDACGRPLSANGQSVREQMGASWLAQSTRAAQIHAEIANAIYTQHHSLGVVNADVEVQSILLNPTNPPGPLNPWRYAVENNFNRLDVDIGFSLTSRA